MALERSQLRLLAQRYLRGGIDRQQYRQKRHLLIDQITGGRSRIERVPNDAVAQDARGARRPRPLYLAVGLGVLASLGLLFWGLHEPPDEQVLVRRGSPAQHISRARATVERFVAMHDYSEASLQAFEQTWQALGSEERGNAIESIWFRSFERALKDEYDAQRALAAVDTKGEALSKAQRLRQFGQKIGIGPRLPELDPLLVTAAAERAAELDAREAEQTTKRWSGTTVLGYDPLTEPPSALHQPAEPAPPSTQSEAPRAATGEIAAADTPSNAVRASVPENVGTAKFSLGTPEQGMRWLAKLPEDAFVLQLFAVNNTDSLRTLIEKLPAGSSTNRLELVHDSHKKSLYRILQGPYSTRSEAVAAAAQIVPALQQAGAAGLLLEVRNLRQPLVVQRNASVAKKYAARAREIADASRVKANQAKTSEVARSPALDARAEPAQARPRSGTFTLQLSASSNRENAAALVEQYKTLGLELHTMSAGPAPFRIVFGRFENAEAARTAASKIPAVLRQKVGEPLVKTLDSLGMR